MRSHRRHSRTLWAGEGLTLSDWRKTLQFRPCCRRRSRLRGGVTGVRGGSPENLRSEEHTSELQSRLHIVCRLLLEKKKLLARYGRPGLPPRGGCHLMLTDGPWRTSQYAHFNRFANGHSLEFGRPLAGCRADLQQ